MQNLAFKHPIISGALSILPSSILRIFVRKVFQNTKQFREQSFFVYKWVFIQIKTYLYKACAVFFVNALIHFSGNCYFSRISNTFISRKNYFSILCKFRYGVEFIVVMQSDPPSINQVEGPGLMQRKARQTGRNGSRYGSCQAIIFPSFSTFISMSSLLHISRFLT